MIVDNIFRGFQKSGINVEWFYFLYRYGDFTLYFALLPSARDSNPKHLKKKEQKSVSLSLALLTPVVNLCFQIFSRMFA
jgi:hypothetical protein